MRNLRSVVDWIEHRTGLESAIKNFLYEEIPASAGWHQVLGSIAMFSFLVQAFTGILLAFNYAPTPGDAYNSVRYIMTELTGGALIRGLHHWGASLMIIIVVLHMTQVFIWGAYKKPREATWIVGCVLLLITLAFGLTGYLLPWDNRAYWGTVVTTQIASSPPGIGQYVSRLIGGEGSVGVVTFSRFYAMHVLLLPPLTLILMGVHIFLVRKHGVAPAPDDNEPKRKFFPEQVFKDTMGVFVAFSILFCLAVMVRAPLGRLADPTDTHYVPRPEWYFLFLFQTLKLFEGPLELLGSVILPNLAIVALFLVPFIDRSKMVKVTQRTVAIGIVVLAVAGWATLTGLAVASTPKEVEVAESDLEGPQIWQELSPEEVAGIGYFRVENCGSCHPNGKASKDGPDLTTGVHKTAAQMIEHFKRPAQLVPGTSMPPVQLSNAQLNSLAAFLLKLNAKNAEALQNTPQFAVEGAIVYQKNQCSICHQVNGAGMKTGPGLNGVGERRDKQWLIAHFNDPQKLSPGSSMPPYKFNPKDMETLTGYLIGLPKSP